MRHWETPDGYGRISAHPFSGGSPTTTPRHAGRPGSTLRRAEWVAFLATLGLALAVLVLGIHNWAWRAQARKLKNPYPPSAETLAAGNEVYTKHCRNCHGALGDGKGEKAAELSIAPGDFTDRSKMEELSDGELYWQISKGRRPMPAFADKLNEQQRWQVVDYIRTFEKSRNSAGQP